MQRVKHALEATSPRKRLVLGSLTLSVALAAASLVDPRGLRQLHRLEGDIARQQQKNLALQKQNALLARNVKELSTPVDPTALERVARELLGFVRKGEVLFKFE